MQLHKLSERAHFEHLRVRKTNFSRETMQVLAAGNGDPQACYGSLSRDSLSLGCIALILDSGDDEARGHFHESAQSAVMWLEAPGSGGAPRVYSVQMEASESGVRPAAIHAVPQSREPRKLSIISYGQILFTTVAFGDRAAMEKVAVFPEDGYRSPEVVAPPELFGYFRGLKACVRGDEDEARREITAALRRQREAGAKAGMAAALSIMARDAKDLRRHMEERLAEHKKQYQRAPNDSDGVVCLDGLALCRLALDRGMSVEDGPYLPVRLLPNYRPPVH